MGNCQAIDAAALVIQHPDGKIERFYGPLTATEVMRMNPGHYVSLIIPLPVSEDDNQDKDSQTVRFTRVKLLRPADTLSLGHAYRLITSQEVTKVLRAKKYAKTKRQQQQREREEEVEEIDEEQNLEKRPEKQRSSGDDKAREKADMEKNYQATKHERHRARTGSANIASTSSKSWRPSLHSISEAAS